MSTIEAKEKAAPDLVEIDGADPVAATTAEAAPPAEIAPVTGLAAIPTAVRPRSIVRPDRLDDPGLYFNQELSWIDFNWRVLALAMDERTPLLERVRFVAITAAVPTFQGWFDLDALHRPEDYLIVALAVALWAVITRTLWRVLYRRNH